MTSTLQKRVFQHKHRLLSGFTARYSFDRLVYLEEFGQIVSAINREKQLKGWTRAKKLALILRDNPDWADLSADQSWESIPEAEFRPTLKRKS